MIYKGFSSKTKELVIDLKRQLSESNKDATEQRRRALNAETRIERLKELYHLRLSSLIEETE